MTIYKAMPVWSGSMVQNYKDQFKGRYGRDTLLTNDQVFYITETIFDDSDHLIQDEWRVETMLSMENGEYA